MINDMKAPRVVETITRFEMMEVATFVLKGNNQKKKVAEDIYKQGEWLGGNGSMEPKTKSPGDGTYLIRVH